MVVDYFIVKILHISSFMVTDDSHVTDMLKPWGYQAKAIGNDEFVRTETHYESGRAKAETGKMFWQLSKADREKYKVTKEVTYTKDELAWPDDILFRTWDFFGVHLDAKLLEGSFVDLGKALGSQISEEKRNELVGSYPSLFDGADDDDDQEVVYTLSSVIRESNWRKERAAATLRRILAASAAGRQRRRRVSQQELLRLVRRWRLK